jgi:hypothetical protein
MSGHGLFIACVASLAGAIAAPATARAPTGGQVEDLRRVAATFADCVVRTNAPLARGA